MTKDAKRKAEVRARMARTGESYTTALAGITHNAPEPPPRCCCEARPGRCPLHKAP
jgi:hypothetical protein